METVKLFANGQSQAVRLPKSYRFEGEEVYARKIGHTVMLFPKNSAWATFLDGLKGFSDDFMAGGRESVTEQERVAMSYMLDTNICIYLIKKQPESVQFKMQAHMQDGLCISSITLAELQHGVFASAAVAKNNIALNQFLSIIEILNFKANLLKKN